MNKRSVALWFLASAVLAVAGPARAEEAWVLAPSDPESAALVTRLRPLLAQRAGRALLLLGDLAQRIRAPIEPASPAAAAALVAALDAAVNRYYDHEAPARAARAVEDAARAALDLLPRLRERAALWTAVRRAHLLLATDALGRGDAARARAYCRGIAARDPGFDPPARDVPPKIRGLYAEERAALGRVRAGLAVRGPKGMAVFVDGIPRGTAPLRAEVAPGSHEVQGWHDGVLSAPVSVAVPAAGAALTIDPFCTARASLPLPRCRVVLQSAAEVRTVLYFAMAGTGLRVTAWSGDELVRETSMDVPARLTSAWLGDLADFLAGRRERPPVVEGPTVRIVRETVVERPVYKRWWFWTVIGAVIVGGTAAALTAGGGRTMDLVVNH